MRLSIKLSYSTYELSPPPPPSFLAHTLAPDATAATVFGSVFPSQISLVVCRMLDQSSKTV